MLEAPATLDYKYDYNTTSVQNECAKRMGVGKSNSNGNLTHIGCWGNGEGSIYTPPVTKPLDAPPVGQGWGMIDDEITMRVDHYMSALFVKIPSHKVIQMILFETDKSNLMYKGTKIPKVVTFNNIPEDVFNSNVFHVGLKATGRYGSTVKIMNVRNMPTYHKPIRQPTKDYDSLSFDGGDLNELKKKMVVGTIELGGNIPPAPFYLILNHRCSWVSGNKRDYYRCGNSLDNGSGSLFYPHDYGGYFFSKIYADTGGGAGNVNIKIAYKKDINAPDLTYKSGDVFGDCIRGTHTWHRFVTLHAPSDRIFTDIVDTGSTLFKSFSMKNFDIIKGEATRIEYRGGTGRSILNYTDHLPANGFEYCGYFRKL